MDNKEQREKILRRIQALREKTIDKGCTEAEANAALELMNRLLTEYNLTLDEVDYHQTESLKDFEWSSDGTSNSHPIKNCIWVLADFCEIKIWWNKKFDDEMGKWRHVTYFFGEKKDVDLAKYLFNLIRASVDREARIYRETDWEYEMMDRSEKKIAINSFKLGMVQRIKERMNTLIWSRHWVMQENQKEGLVLYKKNTIAKQLESMGMKFKQAARAKYRDVNPDAFDAGHSAGDKIHLGYGVPGRQHKMLK